MFLPIVLTVLVLRLMLTNAQCFVLNTTRVDNDGMERILCAYNDITICMNTTVLTDDCLQCGCTVYGLFCCGYGSRLVFYDISAINQGRCKIIERNCHTFLVRTENEELDTFGRIDG